MRDPFSAAAISMKPGDAEHMLDRHGIRDWEVDEVFANGPRFFRNKNSGSGDYVMTGRTDAGRPLLVIVLWRDERAGELRALTAWEDRRAR